MTPVEILAFQHHGNKILQMRTQVEVHLIIVREWSTLFST